MELHVVLGYSAAGTIRSVLDGRDATVVRFSDNLSYGPIDPPDSVQRRAWVETNLGFDNPDITSDEESFWSPVFEEATARIVWVSRRSAAEYCAFLEYLRRLEDIPTQVIETTDTRARDGEYYRSTGSIPHAQISDLLDSARLLTSEGRATYRVLWQRLQAENSDLRILGRDLALRSAPRSFYDERLLSMVGEEWRPMARVLGEALVAEPADENFLLARLDALVESGVLVERESGRVMPDIRRITV